MNNDLRKQVKQVTAEFYDNGDEKYIMLDEEADELITLIRTATLDEVYAVVWEECSRKAIDNLRSNDE